MTTRGLVLGKFLPPHLGHLHLTEFAARYVDALTIVVGSLAREPIPGSLRAAWMRELMPAARVVHLDDELPQTPDEHPDFWALWRRALEGALPDGVDFVFASEPYGAQLARELNARFVPVDVARASVPISATEIRRDPFAQWRYLPRCVRPHFAARVCVFGPESTGKSTLAARLAAHFDTVWVPEHARALLELSHGAIERDDIERIARGQRAAEDALARSANRVLFTDTDLLTTTIWSDALFGDCPAWLRREADARRSTLHLLCDVDVPWVADEVRYFPDDRRAFFDRCEAALQSRDWPYVILRGTWDERFRRAVEAVTAIDPRLPFG